MHVCLAYLFLHSGQVLSSFKCYFKRKYLNLIDSNCDVDESCPWFFIGTVLSTGPECIINIYMLFTGWEVRTGKIFCRGLRSGPRPKAEGRF